MGFFFFYKSGDQLRTPTYLVFTYFLLLQNSFVIHIYNFLFYVFIYFFLFYFILFYFFFFIILFYFFFFTFTTLYCDAVSWKFLDCF